MDDLEAILALAEALDLGLGSRAKLQLVVRRLDDGRWSARVDFGPYYYTERTRGTSAEAAEALRDRLLALNEKNLARSKSLFQRWARRVGQALRLVDGAVDP